MVKCTFFATFKYTIYNPSAEILVPCYAPTLNFILPSHKSWCFLPLSSISPLIKFPTLRQPPVCSLCPLTQFFFFLIKFLPVVIFLTVCISETSVFLSLSEVSSKLTTTMNLLSVQIYLFVREECDSQW